MTRKLKPTNITRYTWNGWNITVTWLVGPRRDAGYFWTATLDERAYVRHWQHRKPRGPYNTRLRALLAARRAVEACGKPRPLDRERALALELATLERRRKRRAKYFSYD